MPRMFRKPGRVKPPCRVPPTHRKVAMDTVVVVQFRGDKFACERIYWDHASVLRQVGLLKE